jgi:hypothetical protein
MAFISWFSCKILFKVSELSPNCLPLNIPLIWCAIVVLATKRVHIALVNILVTGHQTHCVLIELELLLTAQILVALARVLVLD